MSSHLKKPLRVLNQNMPLCYHLEARGRTIEALMSTAVVTEVDQDGMDLRNYPLDQVKNPIVYDEAFTEIAQFQARFGSDRAS